MPTPILILNASFENPALRNGRFTETAPPEWTMVGAGGASDPRNGDIGNVTGQNVFYTSGSGTTISQTLAKTYNASEVYTFSADIGDPDYNDAQSYQVNLYAGGTLIGSTSGSTGNLDTLQTVTIVSSIFNPSLNGQSLRIEIVNVGGAGEMHVDNVRGAFDVSPDGIVDGTAGDDVIIAGFVDAQGDAVDGADGLDDAIIAGAGDDTIAGGAGNDTITGGTGNDTFEYEAGDGLDEITDFNAGNTGSLTDGDQSNNDFLDLSDFYDNLQDAKLDLADDGILNDVSAFGAGQGIDLNDDAELTFDNTNLLSDTDGDGIADVDDLDDDNDGILDIFERQTLDEGQGVSIAGGGETTVTLDPAATGLIFDIPILDNSFNTSINGTQITSQEIEFQANDTPTGQNIRFVDGPNYQESGTPAVWQVTGTDENPVVRVIIDDDGSVSIFGARSNEGPLQEMELFNGNTFNTFTWNDGGPNVIIVDQVTTGPTNLIGTVYSTFEPIIPLDTDGDGIVDRLDLDSDNDGISDLVESGQDASVVDTNSDGVVDGAVDSNGVPLLSNGGVIPVDSDDDSIADFRDLDSDGDGISDFIEAQPTSGYKPGDGDLTNDDADGDGIVDLFDSNDGTPGGFGGSFVALNNQDGDANPDYLDNDTDGDGLFDDDESGLGAPGPDLNGDGIGDNIGVSYADPGGATDGTDLSTSNLANTPGVGDPDEPDFRTVCLARGTMIKTRKGDFPIETLCVGDQVLTMDHGYQPLRWIGSNALDAIDLTLQPKLKPIRIRADALGIGFPQQDLFVSPQHRILVRSVIAQRMFDTDEVLIPANKLLTLDGIDIVEDPSDGVEYFHMLFAAHEIVFSNGAPTESLFTGREAMKVVSAAAKREIEVLFPEISQPDFQPKPARFIPGKGKLMRKLAQRHLENKKPIYHI